MMSVAVPAIDAFTSGPGMHIPDGFLSAPVAVAGWAAMLLVLALAVRMTNNQLSERAVPLMGVMAAFIFAAQMMNFPVAGGTSGHMLGGALAAILLGPWAAVIVMSAVIGLQAVLFQDGGIAAMGANILNMGIVSALVGYVIYRSAAPFTRNRRPLLLATAFVAAWISVEVAAIATTMELVASGTTAFGVAFPAMVGVHALIGIGEGLITAAALGFILSTRADLVPESSRPTRARVEIGS